MIRKYLSNTNESATVSVSQNFSELNKALYVLPKTERILSPSHPVPAPSHCPHLHSSFLGAGGLRLAALAVRQPPRRHLCPPWKVSLSNLRAPASLRPSHLPRNLVISCNSRRCRKLRRTEREAHLPHTCAHAERCAASMQAAGRPCACYVPACMPPICSVARMVMSRYTQYMLFFFRRIYIQIQYKYTCTLMSSRSTPTLFQALQQGRT